jgi:hypothetical protein
MKLRLRIRHNMLPSDHTIGWRNHKPVVRLRASQVMMADMLDIPRDVYANELIRIYKGKNNANNT